MTTRRSWVRPLVYACLASSLLCPQPASANPVEIPLHLDPIRLEPFDLTRHDAAATAVQGGLYLVYAGAEAGCEPVGFPLLADGRPASPNPIRLVQYLSQCANAVAVGSVGGDALAVWSEFTGTVEHIFAVLQPHATWTHLARQALYVGEGRVPAVAGAGDFGLIAYATNNGMVNVRIDAATWPALPPPVLLAPGAISDFANASAAFGPEVGRAMIAWRRASSIYARIVDSNGDPVTDQLLLGAVPATGLSVTWNGNHFVVVWSTSSSIEFKRIDAYGLQIDVQPIHVASTQGHFAAAASIQGLTLVSLSAGSAPTPHRVTRCGPPG